MPDALESVLGLDLFYLLVGLLGGWGSSWWFYRKGTKDLADENRKLIRQINLVLWGLENAGHFKLERDEKGEVISVAVELKADLVSTASMTGTLHGGELPPVDPVAWPRWRFWERRR